LQNNPDSIPLVLVNLGTIPRYLKSNLLYLKEAFPNRKKILISDRTDEPWLNELGFDLVNSATLIQEWPQHFMVSDRRQFFRDNFWFTSKARLMLLPKFMKNAGLNRILHLENDVWISPKFPFHYFDELDAPLALPKVDNERGIASTLFINGKAGIDLLEKACDTWPNFTDMEILGKILNSELSVFELASTHNIEDAVQGSWLFDGAKLGMFLFGTDPRNSKGVIKRFTRSPLGGLDHDQKIIVYDGQILLQSKDYEFNIVSLHIHSKDRKIFGKQWESVLKKQLWKERLGIKFGFNWRAFWTSIYEVSMRGARKLRSVR
jgi:hypothetical protein